MSDDVDDIAIRWAVRIDAQTMDRTDECALEAWLEQDARHRGALFRAQAGLVLIGGAGADDQPRSAPPAPARRRRLVLPIAIAAGLAAVLALPWTLQRGQEYRTEVGEIRRIALSDGSLAVVNSGSDLQVHYEKAARQLRLDEGEAWFKVAKNTHRPFIVEASGVHIRATGTAFSVRRRDGAVEVVVTEGAVRVWRGDQAQNAISVSAGNTAMIDTASTMPRARTAPIGDRDPLAWRQGGLALNETTVFEAANEFNRYNLAQIEVANPRIGKQPMTGYFQIDRPDDFSRAVADVTGGTVSNKDNKFVIE
ncbi:FecR domain-containing protein [soil metagenome]